MYEIRKVLVTGFMFGIVLAMVIAILALLAWALTTFLPVAACHV